MKTVTSLVIIILGVVLFSFVNVSTTNSFNLKKNTFYFDSSSFWLAQYGKYVFDRENCQKCHILNDEEKLHNPTKKSLDGIGKKNSDWWHFEHLLEATNMSQGSEMPSYAYLFSIKLDNEKLETLTSAKLSKNAYLGLSNYANNMFERLNSDNLIDKNKIVVLSEGLALISYIQQIEASVTRKYNDSIYSVELQRNQKIMEQQWNEFSRDKQKIKSLIYTTNKDSIKEGESLFVEKACSACHGMKGAGLVGPNLTDDYWINANKLEDLLYIIKDGVVEKGMQTWKEELTPYQTAKIVAYIRTLRNGNAKIPLAKEPQGKKVVIN